MPGNNAMVRVYAVYAPNLSSISRAAWSLEYTEASEHCWDLQTNGQYPDADPQIYDYLIVDEETGNMKGSKERRFNKWC